jgi:alpha-D-ribose 1-methylphosphonate 5-triphosphate diphosphatase
VDAAVFEIDKRLAAAGVTTAYAALSFIEVDNPGHVRHSERVSEVVQALNRLHPALLTDLRVHARFEVSTPASAGPLLEALNAGHIQLLSLMDHTPGQGQYRDIEQFINFMVKWRRVDRAYVEREIEERKARSGDANEHWTLARDMAALAAEQGLPIASHDDDTFEKVDLVASLGATICEFPVTLEAAEEGRRRGMHVVMGAPNAMRGESHSGNLAAREAIAAGVVDALAADYHPATLLHAAFTLARSGLIDLPAAIALISTGPAVSLGLHDRGRIAPGMRADLALVEQKLTPRVRTTIRGGVPIYSDGTLALVPASW